MTKKRLFSFLLVSAIVRSPQADAMHSAHENNDFYELNEMPSSGQKMPPSPTYDNEPKQKTVSRSHSADSGVDEASFLGGCPYAVSMPLEDGGYLASLNSLRDYRQKRSTNTFYALKEEGTSDTVETLGSSSRIAHVEVDSIPEAFYAEISENGAVSTMVDSRVYQRLLSSIDQSPVSRRDTSPQKTRTKIGWVIGGVVGGVSALATTGILSWIFYQRMSSSETALSTVSPFGSDSWEETLSREGPTSRVAFDEMSTTTGGSTSTTPANGHFDPDTLFEEGYLKSEYKSELHKKYIPVLLKQENVDALTINDLRNIHPLETLEKLSLALEVSHVFSLEGETAYKLRIAHYIKDGLDLSAEINSMLQAELVDLFIKSNSKYSGLSALSLEDKKKGLIRYMYNKNSVAAHTFVGLKMKEHKARNQRPTPTTRASTSSSSGSLAQWLYGRTDIALPSTNTNFPVQYR